MLLPHLDKVALRQSGSRRLRLSLLSRRRLKRPRAARTRQELERKPRFRESKSRKQGPLTLTGVELFLLDIHWQQNQGKSTRTYFEILVERVSGIDSAVLLSKPGCSLVSRNAVRGERGTLLWGAHWHKMKEN